MSNFSQDDDVKQKVVEKRKFDQIDKDNEEASTDEDEENLFLLQAREVLAQPKKPRVLPGNTEAVCNDNEDTSDEWTTDEELGQDEDVEESEDDNGREEEEETGSSEEDVLGESIELLGAGREEKEEDGVVRAIRDASEPSEKTKPPALKSSSMVTDISFHPERDIIAMCNIDGEISCYKYGIEENELIHTLSYHKKSCRVVMFDANGTLMYSASTDKSIVMTDVATMTISQRFQKAHSSPVYSMVCMGENIWASGDDDGVVKVWDLRRNVQKPVYEVKEMEEFVSSMVTDSNNRLLLCTSGEGTLTAFNTRARKMQGQSEVYPSEMNCLGLIRQETKVLTGLGGGNMYIFDWQAFGYHSDSFGDHPSAINCMLPITENIVLTGCDDGKIRAVNLFPHKFLGVVGQHRFPIERLDISTCGSYVASCSHDNRVRFWNITFFEDPEIDLLQSTTKKSVRNKKRSLRKEKIGFQLPSSHRRNKNDFFSGLAESEPDV